MSDSIIPTRCFLSSSLASDSPHSATHPDHTSSKPIGGVGDITMGTVETTLAALKEASALAGKIPYIAPVAGLLQVLTMRDASVRILSVTFLS